jgi:hypothetical protein
MGTAKTRLLKIEWLKNTIQSFFTKKPDLVISKQRIIAEFCIAHNSTDRTAKELLKVMENMGLIVIEKDNIKRGKF